MKNNFNLYKKENVRKNRKNSFFKKMSFLAMTLILLLLPINPTINLPIFNSSVVHAQSLDSVNLLEQTNINTETIEPIVSNTFAVNLSGENAFNKNIAGDGNVINVHFDFGDILDETQENIELEAVEDGQVTVTFEPFYLSAISEELDKSIHAVSDDASSKVFGAVDKILNNDFFENLVTISGVAEFQESADEFKQLAERKLNIADFEGEIPIDINENSRSISMDFTDQIKNHVTTSVENKVLIASKNLRSSVGNVKYKVFPKVGFFNPINKIIDSITDGILVIGDKINSNIIGPILDSGIIDTGYEQKSSQLSGHISGTVILKFNNARSICTDDGSEGDGFYPVATRGIVANQVVTNSDIFYETNESENIELIVFPNKKCSRVFDEVYANTIKSQQHITPLTLSNLPDFWAIPEEIVTGEDTDSEQDGSTDGDSNADEEQDDSTNNDDGTNNDDDTNAETDNNDGDNENNAEEDSTNDGDDSDDNSGESADTGNNSESSSEASTDVDIDMDEVEEGLGLLKRLIEIIMKILNSLSFD